MESPTMRVTRLRLEGLALIELAIRDDQRGFFVERFHLTRYQEAGLPTQFVQENHSRSVPSVLRGLHYQHTPPQGKLVGVTRGHIWDVVVDIRYDSPTYGQHLWMELSDRNGRLVWIPPGFAHGFCVLGDEPADLVYKVDAYYNPLGEAGIHWADADLAIPWPVRYPIVSERDGGLPTLAEYGATIGRQDWWRPPRDFASVSDHPGRWVAHTHAPQWNPEPRDGANATGVGLNRHSAVS